MTNRVVLIGRLVRDPELRTTSTGKYVCDFSIAVQKRGKPQEGAPDADFFKINAWDKTAEYVGNYLHKGRLVAVDGRLQTRKYTNNEGITREIVEILAENVQSLERPREEGVRDDNDNRGSSPESSKKDTKNNSSGPVSNYDEFDPFAED